ncbi:MAG: TonB-dependent receptor plug domain-containing protein [Nitrospirales bacterium]|nr:TonB-dependent receptor plug domain-containing protein [Nitrospirales bacterium]
MVMRLLHTLAVFFPASVLFSLLWADSASGHDQEEVTVLEEVQVVGERPIAASSNRIIPNKDILLQPQGRPADLLRLAPGLITLEHSGGAGKADQFLLRGFDADHGTDLALHVDGMPINMRSHAHGQGYGDINFIIPETIEEITVKKGPYHVEYGDFATAGAANYVTRESVPDTVLQAGGGSFNTQRYLFMTSPTHDRVRTLFAGEFYYTDGPYDFVNRNTRYNGLAKLTFEPSATSQLSVTFTQYYGRWNGSGQIPLREVEDGSLDRFGSLDPSEGGKSVRSTGRLDYHYDFPGGGTAFANLWAQYYYLSLYTNFTFFLNDPVNGDGIEQTDRRWLTGGDIGYRQTFRLLDREGTLTAGLQTRFDNIHVRLGTQQKRSSLAITQESDIFEASYSPYLKVDLQFLPWLRFAGGGRLDVFTYNVNDRCGTDCSVRPNGTASDSIASGKANLIFGPWAGTEFFMNAGTGFHSNDARDVVLNPSATTLTRAIGYELGIRSQPWTWTEFFATAWLLDLGSELVFVGDEGTTEPRGKTRRLGTEFSARLTPLEWLSIRGDVTYTHAEFRKTGDAVPLAPEFTAFSSVTARLPIGLSGTLQMLTVGSRAGTEDNHVKLEPFTIFDLVLRYKIPLAPPTGRLEAFFSIRNLTDTDWRQAQFFYESRLPGEPTGGVADIHFVPGTPRMFMGGLTWFFPI